MRKRSLRAVSEFEGASLGDKRLDSRLLIIAERMAAAPAASIPEAMASVAEREAAYRFFGNEGVHWEEIVAPHFGATIARAAAHRLVRVAHDTSFCIFGGERRGLARVMQKQNGFGLHAALVVCPTESREPLGTVSFEAFVRSEDVPDMPASKRVLKARKTPREDKESARWSRGIIEAARRLAGAGVDSIHVADRECDDFAGLASLCEAKCRFVVRGDARRRLTGEESDSVIEKVKHAPVRARRTVVLGRRDKPIARYEVRAEREAELVIRGTSVQLRRPPYAQTSVQTLRLNVVQVDEVGAPEDAEPVSWTLYTTEPVDTPDDVLAVVDHYRSRWRIEELFKALKTGCAYEARQLTSIENLLRVLAVSLPIAWSLLAMRVLANQEKPVAARTLIDQSRLLIIAALAKAIAYRRLPEEAPTIRDAMLAVAAIGGHVRGNGDPGWQVLGRGWTKILEAERVHHALIGLKL